MASLLLCVPLVLVCASHVRAQGPPAAETVVFPVIVEHKMGFINADGKIVISPRFTELLHGPVGYLGPDMRISDDYSPDRVTPGGSIAPPRGMSEFFTPFIHGVSIVCRNERFGYVSESGEIVAAPQYLGVSFFQENVAWAEKQDGYALIDRHGRELASGFEKVGKFGCGIAPVCIDGKWGFVDTKGRVVAEPSFDYVGRFSGEPISLLRQQKSLIVGNLCSVAKAGKHALINSQGQLLTPFIYNSIVPYPNELATCRGPNGESVISSKGEMLFENVSFEIAGVPHRNFLEVRHNGRAGLLGPDSVWLQEARYRWITDFVDGIAVAVGDDAETLISCDGELVSSPFPEIADASDGYYWFRSDSGKWGVLNREGIQRAAFLEADLVSPCARGLAVFHVGEKVGIVHQDGRIIRPANLESIHTDAPDGKKAFDDGFAVFEADGKRGLLSADGQIVVAAVYDWLDWKECSGLRVCHKGWKHGYVDSQGTEVVPLQYDYAERFRAGLGRVGVGCQSDFGQAMIGGKWGYVDRNGHVVWEPSG